MRFRKAVVAPLLLFSFACGVNRASAQTGFFFDEFGASPKATAMGQAFTAVADDYSAAYYNPAGLTQIKNIFEGTAGYMYGQPNVWANFIDRALPDLHGQPASRGMLAGIASSLDFKETVRVFPWFRRFSFGLVSWVNLPEINEYHSGPVASRPHFLRHDMRFQLLSMAMSLGFEVMPWFSVGAGMIPSVDSVAEQDSFAALNYRDDVVRGLRLSIHQTAKVLTVPVAGILIKPPFTKLQDKFSLGISYRGDNVAHHGKGTLNQILGTENSEGDPNSKAIAYPLHYTINLISFAPEQATIGIAAKAIPGLTIAYDVTWKRWSEYQTYLEQKPNPPFDDTFTHRVGVDYQFNPGFRSKVLKSVRRISLRAGYYYEPTPVTNGIGTDNIFDSDQDVYSAGACVTVQGKTVEHSFDVFYQYHHFHDHFRMAYIDPILAYENHIIASGYSPVEFGGNVWAVGGTYTIKF